MDEGDVPVPIWHLPGTGLGATRSERLHNPPSNSVDEPEAELSSADHRRRVPHAKESRSQDYSADTRCQYTRTDGGIDVALYTRGRGRARGRGRGRGSRGRSEGHENSLKRWQSSEMVGAEPAPPAGQTQTKEYIQRPMGFRKLTELTSSRCYEDVALGISSSRGGFELLINSNNIKPDLVHLILHVLEMACKSTHSKSVIHILAGLCASHFIEKHIMHFLTVSLMSSCNARILDTLSRILFLFENIEHRLPSSAEKCIASLLVMETTFKSQNVNNKHPEMEQKRSELFELCQNAALVVKEEKGEKFFHRRRDAVLNADDDVPPGDFREIEIFPNSEDLQNDMNIFLRKNKEEGAYADLDTYLDVQFRLLREDYIQPLRKGILEYRRHLMKGEESKRISDLRLYKDIHILGSVCSEDIETRLKFDTSTTSKLRWQASKRLIYGSLVCLSQDNFETTIFATVTNRNVKDLEQGVIQVRFETGIETIVSAASTDTFIMAETTAYFEAYKHVLYRLQDISEEKMPFQRYIVQSQTKVYPPKYLLNTGEIPTFDLSPLALGHGGEAKLRSVPVLTTARWPGISNFDLDSTQLAAVQTALTKELAIIQGPPGTGKTYVGLKIAEILLRNRSAWAKDPTSNTVLVVCYTNHALDQFLEGIMKFVDEGIVRVGGRSSSEALQKFNLKELRMERRKKRIVRKSVKDNSMDCRKSMTTLKRDIEEVGGRMEVGFIGLLHERVLSQFMEPHHYNSLTRGLPSGTALKKWLGFENVDTKTNEPMSLETEINKWVNIILHPHLLLQEQSYVNDDKVLSLKLVERVQHYRTWLKQFRFHMLRKVEEMEHSYTDNEELGVLRFHLDSSNNEIMMDTLIRSFVPRNMFKVITAAEELGHGEDGYTIKAWLRASKETWNDECVSSMHDLKTEAEAEAAGEAIDADNEDLNVDEEADIIASHRFVDDQDDVFQTKSGKSTFPKAMEDVTFSMKNLAEDESDHIDSSVGTWKLQPHQKKKMKKHLEHILMSKETMTKRQVEMMSSNVWKVNMDERPALYRSWLHQYQDFLKNSIQGKEREYHDTSSRLKEVLLEEDKDILEEAVVIGMTTTGAAKHAKLLQAIAPRIIIVEEAAEVLESHIITALNSKCQHLILIGDHQQLKPNPTVYDLAKKYNLDLSLFERLINNKMHHVTLGLQHRMSPEISLLMKHIYPNIDDHDTVRSFPNVLGVEKNIFFLHHEFHEVHQAESKSKSNEYEAAFITALCRYFLLQGYKPSDVTILAAYTGQILLVKKHMAKHVNLFKGVRVTSIDNYQGEEAKIILLSLVRSNEEGSVGFLSIDNRVCVAISRAKEGLYAVGNFKILVEKSKLWVKIVETLKEKKCMGLSLRLVCQNHPDMTIAASKAADIEKGAPEGGCTRICDARLKCGHVCERICHNVDRSHKIFKCMKQCQKGFANCEHACPKKCFQKCSKCCTIVPKFIPMCEHTDQVPCSTDPHLWSCRMRCGRDLPCGHKCTATCGDCTKRGHQGLCQENVEMYWPCGHVQQITCHESNQSTMCPRPCTSTLDCRHKCTGTCGACLHGRVHNLCSKKCTKKLPCGHHCPEPCGVECTPCTQPCSSSCSHSRCMELCGQVCRPCKEPCHNGCEHSRCTKLCSEPCNNEPCNKPCSKSLPCKHECVSLCGEECICIECNSEYFAGSKVVFEMKSGEKYIKLQPCGHIFQVQYIKTWMMASVSASEHQPRCPHGKCQKILTKSVQFMDIIRKGFLEVQDMKKMLNMQTVNALEEARTLKVSIVGSSLPMATIRTLASILHGKTLTVSSVQCVKHQFQMLVDLDQSKPPMVGDVLKDTESLEKHLLQRKPFMSAQLLREYKSEIQAVLMRRNAAFV